MDMETQEDIQQHSVSQQQRELSQSAIKVLYKPSLVTYYNRKYNLCISLCS